MEDNKEVTKEVTEEQKPQEQQTPGCTGNCKMCSEMQRTYCASQIAYYLQNLVTALGAQIRLLEQKINGLAEQVSILTEAERTREASMSQALILPGLYGSVAQQADGGENKEGRTAKSSRKKA